MRKHEREEQAVEPGGRGRPSRQGRGQDLRLIGLLDAIPIRLAYKTAFITNFYREPLLQEIELTHGLSRPEWTILICLAYQDGLNPKDICAFTEQPRNNVSRGANMLESKGLITRDPDPQDARRAVLCLTPEGAQLYARIMPAFLEREKLVFSVLDVSERRTLDRLLTKVAQAMPVER
jgi:DNA-binding MarR family transcriptional regulator